MIAYSMVGVSDLDKSKAFYDTFLGELGAKCIMSTDRAHFYGNGPGNPMFGICIPYDKDDPHPGNGTMTTFGCKDQSHVEAAHQKALALGATDEGAPGGRGPGNALYLAYFRDADGNKLAVYCPSEKG
jgi:catechol 2,3-dioxygenase-like lactoylglutathione lyase family enzyme